MVTPLQPSLPPGPGRGYRWLFDQPQLRHSNILPHSIMAFDVTRQLARGDIILTDHGANVIIKWSKTIQNRTDIHTIPIPILGESILCPYKAVKSLLHHIPGSSNQPLFRIPRSHGLVPLTDSVARRHLHSISKTLNIAPPLKFHDFRRSGATCAFHNGVPLQDIMFHGTWKSDSVWKYIKSTPQLSSPVSSTFQRLLHPESFLPVWVPLCIFKHTFSLF